MAKQTKNTNTLYNIFGARLSKAGNGVNVSLVKGEGDDRQFANIYLPFEGKGKTKVVQKDGKIWISVDLLQDKKTDDKDLPF